MGTSSNFRVLKGLTTSTISNLVGINVTDNNTVSNTEISFANNNLIINNKSNSGSLILQTNSKTALTISADGSATFSGGLNFYGGLLGSVPASNLVGTIAPSLLGSGLANSGTYLRGDNTWQPVTSGASITDDISTNDTRYILFDDVTSGAATTVGVSSSKLYYNPGTGQLNATKFVGDGSGLTGVSPLSQTYTIKTSAYTAVAGDNLMCNTSASGFAITLPANPVVGNSIRIADYAGTFDVNNLIIARNGSNIMGLADDYICKIKNMMVTFTYVDSVLGWKLIASSDTGTFSIIESHGVSPNTITYIIKSSNYTFAFNDNIAADTRNGPFTLTLPLNPIPGTEVRVIDYAGTFKINNLTISRNGKNIMGLAEDIVCNTNNVQLILNYVDTTQGWKLMAGSGINNFSIISDNNAGGSSGVLSVNGKIGTVVLAKSDIGLANVQNVDATNASNLSSGTVALARLGTGTPSATTYLRGDNSWQPAVTSVSGRSGAVTLTKTDVGLSNVQNVDTTVASNITSGLIPVNVLGTGGASASTFLRGDRTWASAVGYAGAARYVNDNWQYPTPSLTTVHVQVSIASSGNGSLPGEYYNLTTSDIYIDRANGTITINNNPYILFISFEATYQTEYINDHALIAIAIDTVGNGVDIAASTGQRWARILSETTAVQPPLTTIASVNRLNIGYMKDVNPGTTLYLTEQFYSPDPASRVRRTEVMFTLIAFRR